MSVFEEYGAFNSLLYLSQELKNSILLPLNLSKTAGHMTSSIDLDQTPSDLVLHWMLRTVCPNIKGKYAIVWILVNFKPIANAVKHDKRAGMLYMPTTKAQISMRIHRDSAQCDLTLLFRRYTRHNPVVLYAGNEGANWQTERSLAMRRPFSWPIHLVIADD